jgi:hypothetical protein
MLAFQPSLSALADARRLQENADLASSELPQSDLVLLAKVLELCAGQTDIRSMAEHFRGGEFELLVREIEAGSLKWEKLDQEALQAEFVGAWSKLLERFQRNRMTRLLEANKRPSELTDTEREQFGSLQHGAVNETPG